MALQRAIRRGDFGTARALLDEQESLNDVDDEKETALSCAAATGSIELVKQLWTRDAKVTADVAMGGAGPMCAAARHGHVNVVELLLSRGVDPDLTGDTDDTPLSLAARRGHYEVVKILVMKGAHPDGRKHADPTPLLVAARKSYIEIIKILIEKGANPDQVDERNRTPLSVAAEYGHIEAVKVLVGNGVNPNSPGEHGRTPFLFAACNGHTEVVQFLAENGADMSLSTLHDSLTLAAGNGSVELVRWLLEKSAASGLPNNSYQTPLFTAAENGHVEIVQVLIHYGAEPNWLDASNQTPLSVAAEKGHSDVVELLVQNSADPNLPVPVRKTPLYVAADSGHARIVEYLIQEGANPDVVPFPEDVSYSLVGSIEFNEFAQFILDHIASGVSGEETHTPHDALIDKQKAITELMHIGDELSGKPYIYSWLLWAARYGRHNFISKSISKGIHVEDWSQLDIFNAQHQTPLSLAAQHGHYDFVGYIISGNPVVDVRCTGSENEGRTALSFAAEGGFSGITELLLSHGADQGIKSTGENWKGQIPLSIAAAKGHWEVVENLLSDASFEPDFQDSTGRTPLWWAASCGQAHTVEKLLGHGALADFRDKDGLTSLLVAASNGHEKVVRRLIDLGNLSLKDNNGHTALWLALLNAHYEVAQILMEKDETTLHCMVEQSALATAEILLKAGYNIEKVDSQGLTPLRLALHLRKPEFANLLLRYSASTRDIHVLEWHKAFAKHRSAILQLSVSEDGGGQIDFVPQNSPPAHTNMGTRIW